MPCCKRKAAATAYPLESLLGHWRLFYCSGKAHLSDMALGKGFYAVVRARFPSAVGPPGENPSKAEIGNEIQFGSLLFKLTGPAQYLGKNLLAFDFTHMKLMLFGRAVYSGGFRGVSYCN